MSGASPIDADLLEPPDDATVNAAIEDYARTIREAYGERVKGIYLFGSRARGDHTRESDADIAVVLADGDWRTWPETKRLIDVGYDILLATGADLRAWPIRESEWDSPELSENAAFVTSARRDARLVGGPYG